MISKKIFGFFLLTIFLTQLLLLLFFNRTYLLNNYDASYWKERFEHSQWSMPLSNRIIGDDGLFSYVGDRLAQGEDPSKINPETQPVGKYLIGFSIQIFKNSVYYSLVLGFLTLSVFFLLTKKVFKNNLVAFVPVLILFLDPLFYTQLWKPWIDITQLFFLFCNILLIFYINEKSKNKYLLSLVCGLSLGLFVQTKLPVLLPLILILEFLFFFKNKLKKELIIYCFGLLIGILAPYTQYFLLGNSLIDFFRLQKFIINFYQSSLLVTHPGAIWQSLILGNFTNIAGGGNTRILEWWILWPVTFLISIITITKLFLKKESNFLLYGLAIFLIIELIVFALIPAYPRYLLLVIPFIYLFSVYFIENYLKFKYKYLIYLVVLFFCLLNSFFFLLPKPEPLLASFYHNFSNQYFKDIYVENILKNSVSMDKEKFRIISQKALQDATVKAIEIKEKKKSVPLFSDKGEVIIEITYKTQDLGAFSQEKKLELVKEDSQWKIKWNFEIVLDEFNPDYIIKTSLINGKRGAIVDSFGKIYAKDDLGYLILVNPKELDTSKEQEMLKVIGDLVEVVPVRLQNTYIENPLPDLWIPLATIFRNITKEEEETLLSFKGIKLTSYYSRFYYFPEVNSQSIKNTFYNECCTRIYSSFSYHGISGIEKEEDTLLSGQSGGEILIINNKGEVVKTILKKESKNGQDAILAL